MFWEVFEKLIEYSAGKLIEYSAGDKREIC